tara:strand:+ start:638 stop:883 length:246 start_codon:yes stop_codon:yes gene_type:complete
MAYHYFKEQDSYYKLIDETHEVICITSNFTNKCAAMSIDNSGGYDIMKNLWLGEADGIELSDESEFNAVRNEVRDYIIENL